DPGLREVNVHAGDFGPAAYAVQAASVLTAAVTRVPGVGAALRLAGEQAAGLVPAPAPGSAPAGESWVAAVARDGSGRRIAEVRLRGGNPYAFTAGFLAWAVRRAAHAGVEPTGGDARKPGWSARRPDGAGARAQPGSVLVRQLLDALGEAALVRGLLRA